MFKNAHKVCNWGSQLRKSVFRSATLDSISPLFSPLSWWRNLRSAFVVFSWFALALHSQAIWRLFSLFTNFLSLLSNLCILRLLAFANALRNDDDDIDAALFREQLPGQLPTQVSFSSVHSEHWSISSQIVKHWLHLPWQQLAQSPWTVAEMEKNTRAINANTIVHTLDIWEKNKTNNLEAILCRSSKVRLFSCNNDVTRK